VQAAELLIKVHQPGGEARQAAVPSVGLGGHLDGATQGVGEVDESGGGRSALGQLIKRLLRGLDLILRALVMDEGERVRCTSTLLFGIRRSHCMLRARAYRQVTL
jgi:hypothetical protein